MNEKDNCEVMLLKIDEKLRAMSHWHTYLMVMVVIIGMFVVSILMFTWIEKKEIVEEIRLNRTVKQQVYEKLNELRCEGTVVQTK